MGYRSDIAIAIHKNIVARDLIDPIIPDALKNEPHQDNGDTRYWYLSGWKWCRGYLEVAAIEKFFDLLNEEGFQIFNQEHEYSIYPYGAIRIGEDDDDVENWGDPSHYDIHLSRSIQSPFTG